MYPNLTDAGCLAGPGVKAGESILACQHLVSAGQATRVASFYSCNMKKVLKMAFDGGLALAVSMFISAGLVSVFSYSLAVVSRL